MLIEIKNAKKTYGSGESLVKALDNVDLSLEEGKVYVILGPSGSGKSTLLNMVGGLDTLTSGQIVVDNQDISKATPKELTEYRRKTIGFIFQFYNLLPDLTALENVKLSIHGHDEDDKAKKTLELVGLGGDKMNHYPSQMSGGEQQRVSIARALVKNAKFILCDEPTGALDDKTGRKILILLQELVRNQGQTMIIVTHTTPIAQMANRVIHLRDGKIQKIEINEHPLDANDIEW